VKIAQHLQIDKIYHRKEQKIFYLVVYLVDLGKTSPGSTWNLQDYWADVGAAGSASDAQIFNSCELKECLENGSLGLPEPKSFPNENMPYFATYNDETFYSPWSNNRRKNFQL